MAAIVDPEKCKGSEKCLDICPTGAIDMKDGKAVVIPENCADCGACIEICPNEAIKMDSSI